MVFNKRGLSYSVDVVFCIDATESMDPFLDVVKENALNFYQDFMDVMEQKKKKVQQLRVRVVAFRDYMADGREAMLVTDFFLPHAISHFLLVKGLVLLLAFRFEIRPGTYQLSQAPWAQLPKRYRVK